MAILADQSTARD